MCITMRVAWLTIDRLRSGRDIRLSTATMRALNSRRPRSPSVHRLAPRPTLCLLLLLYVFQGARARSVPHDDDGGGPDQVHGRISAGLVEASHSDLDGAAQEVAADDDEAREEEARARSLTEEDVHVGHGDEEGDGDVVQGGRDLEERLVGEPEKMRIEIVADEGSVAKKRRRNDVSLLGGGKSVLQDEGKPQKDEGIRRFDAQVESDDDDDSEAPAGQRKMLSDGDLPPLDHQRGSIDVKIRSHADRRDDEDGTRPEGESYSVLPHEELGDVDVASPPAKTDSLSKEDNAGPLKSSAAVDVDAERVRNDLRRLELGDSRESGAREDPDREQRRLAGPPGKPKYKSSTVYLSAEEGGTPGRDQESIVDGQIKKLISIRDDALESAVDGVKAAAKLDDEAPLAGRSVGVDAPSGAENEEIRNQRSSSSSDTSTPAATESPADQPSSTTGPNNRLQAWRDQAAMLQEQIRNRTFIHYLREHAIEVLPDIPRFTESQLLETLRSIWQSRASVPAPLQPSETFSGSLSASELSHEQLEIIKCAEQLMETRQRQSFVGNVTECIRGLSVLNCMRIFVWPIVLNNIPESVRETLNNLPVEVNLMDLFQRPKAARSESGVHRPRLLTPESVVFAILRSALDTKTTYDQAPVYIDSKNETLRRLLTIGQLQILQMAERLLPGEARREYSDRMFSCVRRFEYFSCVKYFAWPMVRQYHADLPDFPDYQAWYPPVAFYPQYPIVPFPSFVEMSGQLPEVVDADATRMRRPKPEAVIVSILQNTLREHAKVPPPSVAHDADSYVALLPPEQLLSIRMAEQLLPTPYRPEFVQKTVRCIQDFSYMTCIKYSMWPTVRQTTPGLPDITLWFPNFPQVFGSYLPELPNFSDYIPSFISGLGGGGGAPTPANTEQPPQSGDSTGQSPARFPAILLRQHGTSSSEVSSELENKITEILMRVRNSLKATPDNSQLVISGNVIVLTAITDKQIDILKLAESILPPAARAPLVNQVLSCLRTNNDFVNCTRYVVWPTMALYVPNLPAFPSLPPGRQPPRQQSSQQQALLLRDKNSSHRIGGEQQDAASPNVKIISRTKYPQSNAPVISVTGTRFVPIFTEHPESVILNILRSIQLSLPSAQGDQTIKVTDTQQFVDLFNDQQGHILRAAENLLPDTARPSFIERMMECVRRDSFLVCSREVLWPTLSEYFPRLPSFPNFGAHPQATDSGSKPTSPQNLTDPSPFSETDVRVGQHGDATVTITDTRFFPIFTEHPEGVILNILRAVQHATPGLLNPMVSPRSPEIQSYFTEQQANIVQVAESLLPESVRPVFVERMVSCVRESTFLECTRDIAWPTIAQFFPRLPNFPNFGRPQSAPRTKLDLSSILLRNAYSKSQQSDEKASDTPDNATESAEDRIESVLKGLVSEGDASVRLDNSYLDASNPAVGDLLTAREINIMRLTEKAIPDSIRRAYVTSMLECVRSSNNFMTCAQHISWPTLKQYAPALPSFDQLFGQFPGVGAIPDLTGQLPTFPGVGNYPFAEFPSQITGIPGAIQGGIPAGVIPGGIQDGISQIPGFPEFPGLGGFGFPSYAKRPPAAALPAEAKPEQTTQPRLQLSAERTNQISGVSVAANTPSVDQPGVVPGYFGQPSSILIDIAKEKVRLSDIEQQRGPSPGSVLSDQSSTKRGRRRRSAERLSNLYVGRTSATMDSAFPNITESELLQLLVNISRSKAEERPEQPKTSEYFVDTLNSTIRNSLTADQYEILKIVEDLSERSSDRGLLTRVIQCIRSLSFIRCIGIFVWPMITSTVPSLLGLPSLPSIPGLGLLGRSTESEVENFFGMSTSDFEKELLARKESAESILLDWYRRLMEDRFQANVGFLKVNGYGNGEVGISFSGFREGRATKIKDNKNLPSILTIISDIMEEVLDQRPDNEKMKKDKEKRERSLEDVQEADFQSLRESDEYADIKRSINDDQIISMFLDKIKANASDFAEGDVAQYLSMENAYNAFSVLFGTRLNDKFASRLKAFTEEHLRSFNRENPGEERARESNAEKSAKATSWKEEEITTYGLEKESTEGREERKREHRAKSDLQSLLSKYSDKYARSIAAAKIGDPDYDNRIKDTAEPAPDIPRSELRLQLPGLREDAVVSRKITSAVVHLGRALKMKMSNMLPGIGFVVSFLIQTALAHARAAASMAGMISNMALASAIFGMLRQNLLGSDNPKVKYVYDNDKSGPGITWPHNEAY